MHSPSLRLAVLAGLLAVAACEGGAGGTADAGAAGDGRGYLARDAGGSDARAAGDAADAAPAPVDAGRPDAAPDRIAADLPPPDVAPPDGAAPTDGAALADARPDTPPGADVPPPADGATVPDTVDPPPFCRAFADCAADEVCELALGRCARRSTWLDDTVALFGFHPLAGAAGDTLVLDGGRFFSTLWDRPTVRVGSVTLSGFSLQADENRILIALTAGMAGAVSVTDALGTVATAPTPLGSLPAGRIACDGSTPAASGSPGSELGAAGPYAAAYVDLGDETATRVFYPATCGSVRRPAQPGTWPVVGIFHGNGALHINYEYLAELLATWGFVSFMPRTQMNMAGDDFTEMLREVLPVVTALRGRDLTSLHPALAGVATTEEIAFVGHSRGCGRIQEVIGADAGVRAGTVAVVFLGPVDDGDVTPGAFLVFGAGQDRQSFPLNYESAWSRQPPPRWFVEIPGGNHGSFADHKVYGYGGFIGALGDGEPTVTRPRQLFIVQSFTLPLFQRAFGLDEPFADQLDLPPPAADYEVQWELDLR